MATTPTPVVDPAEEPTTTPLADPEDSPPEEQPTPEAIKALRAELRAERRAREAAEKLAEERKATKDFWEKRDKAERTPKPVVFTPTPEPDPLEELDLLSLLTEEKDPAKIRKTFAKAVDMKVKSELARGNFVSQAQMEAHIAKLIEGAGQISRLVTEFPQLSDPKSEFFAETQRQLAVLSDDPAYQGTPEAVLQRMAAQQAKIKLIEAGKLGNESADDRYERVANQRGGSRGRARPQETTVLTPEQKAAAARYGVTEKEYLEQLNKMQLGPALTAERALRQMGEY